MYSYKRFTLLSEILCAELYYKGLTSNIFLNMHSCMAAWVVCKTSGTGGFFLWSVAWVAVLAGSAVSGQRAKAWVSEGGRMTNKGIHEDRKWWMEDQTEERRGHGQDRDDRDSERGGIRERYNSKRKREGNSLLRLPPQSQQSLLNYQCKQRVCPHWAD